MEENSGSDRQKRWKIGNGGTVFKLSTGDGRKCQEFLKEVLLCQDKVK